MPLPPPLEVPYWEVPVTTLHARYRARQLGDVAGDDCGCRSLWWLLAAAVVGAGVGVAVKLDGEKKRKRRSGR